jgi:hypothetical protein
MRPTDALAGTDWMQAQLNDGAVKLAQVNEDNAERARRHLLCSCDHRRAAHCHYRPGRDCALCMCPRWSPRNPGLSRALSGLLLKFTKKLLILY